MLPRAQQRSILKKMQSDWTASKPPDLLPSTASNNGHWDIIRFKGIAIHLRGARWHQCSPPLSFFFYSLLYNTGSILTSVCGLCLFRFVINVCVLSCFVNIKNIWVHFFYSNTVSIEKSFCRELLRCRDINLKTALTSVVWVQFSEEITDMWRSAAAGSCWYWLSQGAGGRVQAPLRQSQRPGLFFFCHTIRLLSEPGNLKLLCHTHPTHTVAQTGLIRWFLFFTFSPGRIVTLFF